MLCSSAPVYPKFIIHFIAALFILTTLLVYRYEMRLVVAKQFAEAINFFLFASMWSYAYRQPRKKSFFSWFSSTKLYLTSLLFYKNTNWESHSNNIWNLSEEIIQLGWYFLFPVPKEYAYTTKGESTLSHIIYWRTTIPITTENQQNSSY